MYVIDVSLVFHKMLLIVHPLLLHSFLLLCWCYCCAVCCSSCFTYRSFISYVFMYVSFVLLDIVVLVVLRRLINYASLVVCVYDYCLWISLLFSKFVRVCYWSFLVLLYNYHMLLVYCCVVVGFSHGRICVHIVFNVVCYFFRARRWATLKPGSQSQKCLELSNRSLVGKQNTLRYTKKLFCENTSPVRRFILERIYSWSTKINVVCYMFIVFC